MIITTRRRLLIAGAAGLGGLALGGLALGRPGWAAGAAAPTPAQTEGPYYPDVMPTDTDADSSCSG